MSQNAISMGALARHETLTLGLHGVHMHIDGFLGKGAWLGSLGKVPVMPSWLKDAMGSMYNSMKLTLG